MEASKWGPPLWFFLHTISFNYPDKPTYRDKSQYYDFFYGLQNILPCQSCKINYIKHLQQNPVSPALDSKKSLVQWVIKIHNLVNIEGGKSVMSTPEVIQKYKDVYENKLGNGYCHYFDNYPEKEKKKQEQTDMKMWKKAMFGAIVFVFAMLGYFYYYTNAQKPQIHYL
jgi:hypothetical protein